MLRGIRYIYKDICESYEDHLILKDNPGKMLTSTMWKALLLGFLGCFLILKAQGIDFFFWSTVFCLFLVGWFFRRWYVAVIRGGKEQEIEENLYRVNDNARRFSFRNSEYPENLIDFNRFYIRDVYTVLSPWQKYISLKKWLIEQLPGWELAEFQASKRAPSYKEYSYLFFYFKKNSQYIEVAVSDNGVVSANAVTFVKFDEDYRLGSYRQRPETYETQQIKEKLLKASCCKEAWE